MAGTPAGGKKSAETNRRKHGPDFYKEIGAKSWKNPNRSRKTGFALLPQDVVVYLAKKGGKKTKSEYQKEKLQEAFDYIETFAPEANKDNSDVSE